MGKKESLTPAFESERVPSPIRRGEIFPTSAPLSPPAKEKPIGIFDSGVGGLSVLRAIRRQLPAERVIFLADQAHVPYGSRTLEEVCGFSEAITRYLLSRGAKLIVVACNTASAAALHHLRQTFPEVPFVGMEPAVKPAAEGTQSGVVGVLATPATFQGDLYASVVERFANGVMLLQHTCPGLVGQIEQGKLDGAETRAILEGALLPMLEQGIDTVVLGCTHYPFVIPLIEEIAGPTVRVIDPAPAVARQVGRLLEERGLRQVGGAAGSLEVLTTGDPVVLRAMLPRLLGEEAQVGRIRWRGGELREGSKTQQR
jgi:glutamate racemase